MGIHWVNIGEELQGAARCGRRSRLVRLKGKVNKLGTKLRATDPHANDIGQLLPRGREFLTTTNGITVGLNRIQDCMNIVDDFFPRLCSSIEATEVVIPRGAEKMVQNAPAFCLIDFDTSLHCTDLVCQRAFLCQVK